MIKRYKEQNFSHIRVRAKYHGHQFLLDILVHSSPNCLFGVCLGGDTYSASSLTFSTDLSCQQGLSTRALVKNSPGSTPCGSSHCRWRGKRMAYSVEAHCKCSCQSITTKQMKGTDEPFCCALDIWIFDHCNALWRRPIGIAPIAEQWWYDQFQNKRLIWTKALSINSKKHLWA